VKKVKKLDDGEEEVKMEENVRVEEE